MEYRKIANLIDDASNQPSKLRTKYLVEVNDESKGVYNVNSQIKFKTAVLKSSLCHYSNAYILVKGTITVNNTAAAKADANNTNKKVLFKNCAPFTNCISKVNNIQIDDCKYIDVVINLYNSLEYSDNYAKTSKSLWQFCKDIPAVDNNNAIVNFTENNLTDSFNFKVKMAGQTGDNGTENVEMPLINCEINLNLTWSANCVIVSTNVANQNATFAITDTKLYVPVVTLSTQDNSNLLQQLNSGNSNS